MAKRAGTAKRAKASKRANASKGAKAATRSGGRPPAPERRDDVDAGAPRLRPLWSGTISFGLVSVPVELHPAVRSGGVPMRMLDEDGTPVRRRYRCPEDERDVPWDELVRGYEVAPDEHVVLTDEELDALAPERSREIDLRLFVEEAELEPVAFERGYVLTPAGDAAKPYRLLADAMERTGRAGVATFVMRGKEHLVAILAQGGILRAETLRFADEVRDPDEEGIEAGGRATKDDVAAFERAIRAAETDELDRALLADEDAEATRRLVAAKLRRREDVVEPDEAPADDDDGLDPDADEASGESDLLDAIRASLEAAGNGHAAGDGRARRSRGRRSGGAPAADELRSLSKDELYERAQEADVPGRSSMTKDELVRALSER